MYRRTTELYHHGIKGQRWGVIRSLKQLGYKTKSHSSKDPAKKASSATTAKPKTKTVRKSIKTMTDDELRAKTNRMRLENDYKNEKSRGKSETTSKPKTTTAPAKKAPGEMTNDELRAANERARLIQEYNNNNPKQVSAGKKILNRMGKQLVEKTSDAAVDLGVQYIKSIGASTLNKSLNNYYKDKADDKGNLPEYIFSNNKKK